MTESWIVLLWKWILFWKSGNMIQTLCFMRFHANWPVKRSCTYAYIHMWLVYIHSWGNLLVLVHWPQIIKVVNCIIRTWLKIFIELVYFGILSWTVWYEYIRLYEWWFGDWIGWLAYMLLVSIYVYAHIYCWCLYMWCAYMLLVNFSYMLLVLNCWCKHVLEYVGVDLLKSYEICFVVVES